MKAAVAADRLFSSWPSSKDGPRTRKVRCLAANLKGGVRHSRIAQDKMGGSEARLGQRPRKRITQHVDAGGRRLVKHCRGEHASRSPPAENARVQRKRLKPRKEARMLRLHAVGSAGSRSAVRPSELPRQQCGTNGRPTDRRGRSRRMASVLAINLTAPVALVKAVLSPYPGRCGTMRVLHASSGATNRHALPRPDSRNRERQRAVRCRSEDVTRPDFLPLPEDMGKAARRSTPNGIPHQPPRQSLNRQG